MPRICTVCNHPMREEIDKALLAGEPLRDIAGRVPIAKSALHRHKQHLPKELIKAKAAEEVTHPDSLVDDLRNLATEANRLKVKAEQAGDVRTAISALREVTRLIELRAKIAGELKEGQVNVLNVHVDEETAARMAEIHLSRRKMMEASPS